MKSFLSALLLSITLISAGVAQEAVRSQAAVPSADANKAQAATVYVYRYKQFVGSALEPSVYCDDVELARMDNGRFFTVKLNPGKYTFHSNDKQSGIQLELSGGQDYYIRVELAAGFMKGHGRVVSVPAEQGSYEVKKLKPLDANKVKDSQRVSTSSFLPR